MKNKQKNPTVLVFLAAFCWTVTQKAVEITELKNTMERRKDFGLIWNETCSLFLNEMTLSHCQVCTDLNETFHLWVFFPPLRNSSIELTFEARCCSKMKAWLLVCETLAQNVSPFLKNQFLPLLPLNPFSPLACFWLKLLHSNSLLHSDV